ncbi:golgin subfamily A member 6-like protein 22 [Pseudomyrmex gracilis]|uniref:golgin subfamily A member 6-like protein 22 n=1 Tax=Pseudomyrmex gracilis TaxID=219809 RepID=UPI0009959B25|nr:golgin subfamily A member 6-like protein 22 [Pseudomyrmex gracilis]
MAENQVNIHEARRMAAEEAIIRTRYDISYADIVRAKKNGQEPEKEAGNKPSTSKEGDSEKRNEKVIREEMNKEKELQRDKYEKNQDNKRSEEQGKKEPQQSSRKNCDIEDAEGEALLTEMEDENMIVVNIDTITRLGDIGQRDSNIDLVWARNAITHLIEYKIIGDTWGSDHYPIEITIGMAPQQYRKRSNRITNKKTNWEEYQEILESRIEIVENISWTKTVRQENYDIFCEEIKEAARLASEKIKRNQQQKDVNNNKETNKSNKHNKNPCCWWDNECKEAIDNRRLKQKHFKREKTISSLIAFKKARAEARKLLRFKKREGFRKFARSINKNTGMKYVWNKIRALRKPPHVIDWNKWQNKDRNKEILDNIEKLSPGWAEQQERELEEREEEEDMEEEMNKEFQWIEMERVLRRTKSKSAPGRDNIEYKMIKEMPWE